MADADSGQRFPFINLEKAIGRAGELYGADQRGGEMSVAGAFAVWKYSEKSSGGHQTVAALKAYGLVGSPQSGKVQVSKEALAYFRDEREDERAKLVQFFATRPPLLKSLWNIWGEQPPADTLARSHLKVDRGLSEQSARAVLGIYKENIAFANLKGGDKVPEIAEETPPAEEAQMTQTHQLSPEAKRLLDLPPSMFQPPVAKHGTLQEVFNLDEGPVMLTFPAKMSVASYEDLEAHLQIFLRKAKRRADSIRQFNSDSGDPDSNEVG